jgi:rubredoxin
MSAYEDLAIPCPLCGAEHTPREWWDRGVRGQCPSCGASKEAVREAAEEVLES